MSRTSSLKKWPGWVLLMFVVAGFLAIGTTRDSGPRTPEQRVESITRRLACPVCDGESVYESANDASAAIRSEVRTQVTQTDATDDEIIAYIVQQFGARTQLLPKATCPPIAGLPVPSTRRSRSRSVSPPAGTADFI